MINIRMRQIAREVALTLGAALGVLCVAAAVATPLFGIRLLVFQSGSMSPTIETGGIAVARTVDAADLERGDIVSVTSSEGTRVTHRISDVTHNGNRADLTLRGDANAAPDRETYHVTSADRVIWHANGLGYVIRAFSSPYVIFIAGGAALGLIIITFRRQPRETAEVAGDDEPKVVADAGGRSCSSRTKIISAAAAVAVLGGGGLVVGLSHGVVPTLASFSDTAEVNGDFATMTVPKPAASLIATDDDDVDCTNGSWLSGVVWVGWTNLSNPPAKYRYQVDVYLNDPTNPDVTYTVTDKMATIHRGDLTHGAGTYHTRVYGSLDGTNWRSVDSLDRTIEVGSGGWDIRCSDPYTTRAKTKSTEESSDRQKKSTTQDSSRSDSSAAETHAPASAAPETTAPSATETTTPEPTTPEGSAAGSAAPEPSAAETDKQGTTVPESSAPETCAAETSTPDASTAEHSASQPSTQESSAPEKCLVESEATESPESESGSHKPESPKSESPETSATSSADEADKR